MIRRPPRSTRTDTLFPYTTLVRSTLFTPATVSDRSDGKIAHLDGLGISRAWSWRAIAAALRSEEHTSELQSLMRISYAVFCLKKKKKTKETTPHNRPYVKQRYEMKETQDKSINNNKNKQRDT